MSTLWLADVALLLALLATSEVMFRVGRANHRRKDENLRAQVSTAQTSTLGLLALFLAFTMSMAESRFNYRRLMVIEEAAAVGATYRRTALLPEPARSESRALVRSYVAARRDYYAASAAEAPATTARAQAIHAQLWAQLAAVAPDHLDSVVMALYVQSLDKMIDYEGMRDVAIGARVPWTIRLLIVLVGLLAAGVCGFATGLGGGRVVASIWLLPLLIALAYTVIVDLDRSRAGMISTGDRPMMRLQQTIEKDYATPATRTGEAHGSPRVRAPGRDRPRAAPDPQ